MNEPRHRDDTSAARAGRQAVLVRRIAVVTICVFWAAQFVTLTTMRYLRYPAQGLQYITPRAIVTVAGILISLAILFGQTKMRTAPLMARTLFAIAAALLGCILHGIANELVFASVYNSAFTLTDYFLAIIDWLWFYLSLSIMILLLSHSADLADSRVQIETLRAQASAAQLASLRYQLNPHFLFNALNSIAALVEDRQGGEASRMINRLSDFLRSGLDTDPLEEVPLAAELAQQRRYLEIERIRFPSRLAFVLEVETEVEGALVPSLILQPLVENAIKYGVAPSHELVTIAIEARRIGEDVRIVVRNDGGAHKPGGAGAGIGLHNVRERLASVFGSAASIESGPMSGGGYAVTLTLPLKHP